MRRIVGKPFKRLPGRYFVPSPNWRWFYQKVTFYAPINEYGLFAYRRGSPIQPSASALSYIRPWHLGLSYYNLAADGGLHYATHESFNVNSDISFSGWVLIDADTTQPSTDTGLLCCRDSFTSGAWMLYRTNTNDIVFAIHDGTFNTTTWTGAYAGAGLHSYVFTRYKGGGVRLWVDGVDKGRNSFTTNPASGTHKLNIGQLQSGQVDWALYGAVYSAAVFKDVILLDEEALQLHSDPFGMLHPHRVIGKSVAVGITLEQEGYRWRDDDGNETAATWLANQDTALTRGSNVNTRLRVIVNATGDPASEQYQLEWRKQGAASWNVLTT